MKTKYIIFSLLLIFGITTVSSCSTQTCPTYANSKPTKRKKAKKKKSSAPWHKKNQPMKKGKKGDGVAP